MHQFHVYLEDYKSLYNSLPQFQAKLPHIMKKNLFYFSRFVEGKEIAVTCSHNFYLIPYDNVFLFWLLEMIYFFLSSRSSRHQTRVGTLVLILFSLPLSWLGAIAFYLVFLPLNSFHSIPYLLPRKLFFQRTNMPIQLERNLTYTKMQIP